MSDVTSRNIQTLAKSQREIRDNQNHLGEQLRALGGDIQMLRQAMSQIQAQLAIVQSKIFSGGPTGGH